MAGLNQMSWSRFVVFNAARGILWAVCYGLAAFYFGKSIERFTRPVGLALLLLGTVLFLVLLWFIAALFLRGTPRSPGFTPEPGFFVWNAICTRAVSAQE